jgi:hypothetical protein
MSSSSRSTTFDFAGGNLSDNPIAKVVGAAMGAVKDTLAGIADGTVLSGLAALGGAAFVDIPKHWQSATANLARANYTVTLESPYGNPISQLTNIYIPLAMLLAGVLPISTGKQSYTSPFILELYDQGRCQTRLGIIDSLSITRGVGNLGFNTQGHAMAIEVNFSVIDLSNIVHMPIVSGFSLDGMQTGISAGSVGGAIAGGAVGGVVGAAGGAVVGGAVGAAGGAASDAVRNVVQSINQIFDEDSLYSDYLAVLSGMSLSEQIYQLKKFKRNLTKTLADWDNWTSAANFASFAGDSIPGRLAITTLGTIATGTWNGTLISAAKGGTGVDASTAANGKILIGNGAGFTLANITAGTNITINNTAGGITISSTGSGTGTGTVNKYTTTITGTGALSIFLALVFQWKN